MAGDVLRSSGQWHAAGGAPADGSAPPGPATCHGRHCAVTSGHTGASACAPEAGTARTAVADVAAHDVAPERALAFSVSNVFH
jgi:hypothetical protein